MHGDDACSKDEDDDDGIDDEGGYIPKTASCKSAKASASSSSSTSPPTDAASSSPTRPIRRDRTVASVRPRRPRPSAISSPRVGSDPAAFERRTSVRSRIEYSFVSLSRIAFVVDDIGGDSCRCCWDDGNDDDAIDVSCSPDQDSNATSNSDSRIVGRPPVTPPSFAPSTSTSS